MHRLVRAALAALVVALLAGCWPAPGQGPDRRAHNPSEQAVDVASAPTLAEAWSTAVGTGPPTTPTLGATTVHVSDAAGVVYGLDRATGEQLWQHPDDAWATWHSVPTVDGDRVLTSWGTTYGMGGTWAGGAAWLDARTGAAEEAPDAGIVSGRRGTRVLGWSRGGSPLYVFMPHSLHLVDEAAPANGWSGPIMFTGGTWPQRPPTLGAHRIYHAGTVTTAYATTADSNVTGVHAFPLTAPATDCVAPPPEYPSLPAIRCPSWSRPTAAPPATSPVVGPGEQAVYVALEDGTLLGLGATDGAELWSTALGAAPSADPALAGGWLYVPLADGTLAVVDAATGAVAWVADVGGAGVQPAVAGRATPGADGVVLVGTEAGDLVALPAAGCGAAACAPVATIDVGGAVTGAPAVSGGRVYLGVAPDRVVALAPSGA